MLTKHSLTYRRPRRLTSNGMKPLLEYIKAVRGEFTHVSWPTRNQAIAYTALVIGISIFVAILLGGFDFIFTFGLQNILLLKQH